MDRSYTTIIEQQEPICMDISDRVSSLHPVLKSFLVGSISGTCSAVLFQPLDLLKTRIQQGQHVAPTLDLGVDHNGHGNHSAGNVNGVNLLRPAVPRSSNLITVAGHIIRTENIFGLWRGIVPSLTRTVPGVGLYFATIHSIKLGWGLDHANTAPSPFQAIVLGGSGRILSGILMSPFTVVKTRFESPSYSYRTLRSALAQIYRVEGVQGLTCGLAATLLRDAPFSALYLLMYTLTKGLVPESWLESGPYARFGCGVVAGLGASLVTQPADVIKTKMQLYPDKFRSVGEVVDHVGRKYGLQGYFKGLMPRMVRRTLVAAMSWTVYEQMMKNIGLQ